ncbi:DUF4129 domain-containing protein [Kitasatospora viridis]|uniref:DUF4129 domain-containing protein n=1 Tax=Kitasatospora viridis TaxID=281105 RepID=UPI001478AF74|nr:DUF4129 domain-containing protein [Kitasatospora viridis]
MAALAFAAVLLRPSTGLLKAGRAPLGALLPVLLCCAGWLLAIAAIHRRYQAAVRGASDLSPTADRLRDLTVRLLPPVAVLVPVALLVGYFSQHSKPAPPPSVAPPPPMVFDTTPAPTHHYGLAELVVEVLLGLLAVLAVVLLWRRLRHRTLPRLAMTPAPRPAEEQLAEAIASGRRALLGDDARAAVIACYAAMEESLADSGVTRELADSPSDLLARAVATGSVPQPEATALTELFREARYSRHPMGTPELDRARAALDTIAAQLADNQPAPAEAS